MKWFGAERRGPPLCVGQRHGHGAGRGLPVARELIQELKASGENPKTRAARASQQQQEDGRLARLTVADCFDVYIADMKDRVTKRLVKQSSLTALEDSLARLSRPEVGFAQRAVADVTDDDGKPRSTRCARARWSDPTAFRPRCEKLWRATRTGRSWIRGHWKAWGSRESMSSASASGLAATEHSFTDAHRAVAMVLKRESVLAGRKGESLG